MSIAPFNHAASGENFEQTVTLANAAAISANDIPNINVRGSSLEEDFNEAAMQVSDGADDLILANAAQLVTLKETSSERASTLDIDDQPPASALHEIQSVTIPDANPLKRQRSSDSIDKETVKATKRPRTGGKNLKALKASTDAVDSKSEASIPESVDSHDEYYLGIGEGNKRPSLLLTSGKIITADLISDIRDAFDSEDYLEAMEMIEPVDALPMPNSIAPRYTLETFEQVSQIFALYPYITIRAYEQGLFSWIFHGHPRVDYSISQTVCNYECGLIECDWQSPRSTKVAVWNHLFECKVLMRLEKEAKMKNDEMEKRDREMKEEMLKKEEEEKEIKKEEQRTKRREQQERKKAEKKMKDEQAKRKREEKKLKKEEEAEEKRKEQAEKNETEPRTTRARGKRSTRK
ncbi:hypothetical protein CYLTODRAFT_492105 [Cylindrobasidium torrendii FP15055 ss-10]|uniref:Uncharacterized protein n=1 Tax=Cylindrobasidium torrendii FP15055 ss-10 TaxID=1314674 RepID=A0A0D7B683_9AGAR|nr:hypothetical protein CYLTODRAFT_492105 [Cylindrobasidium torrendii FP15055 ss-10]